MINLGTLAKNHFDTVEISNPNMRTMSEKTLQSFSANNPGGIYSAIITEHTTAHTNYYGAITDEDVKFSLQQGATIAVNDSVTLFKSTVHQKEGTIRGLWAETTPEYQAFFPLGLAEYSQANLSNVETLFERMATHSTSHLAELSQPFVDLFTGLRDSFLAARANQLNLMGIVEGKRITKNLKRDVLEIVLMKAALTVALNNIGNPSIMSLYFDQSFLSVSDSEETFGDDILSGETDNVFEKTLKPTDEVTLEAFDTDLVFGLMKLVGDVVITGITVTAGTSQTVQASALGDVTQNHFLNVTNNTAIDGSWSVTI